MSFITSVLYYKFTKRKQRNITSVVCWLLPTLALHCLLNRVYFRRPGGSGGEGRRRLLPFRSIWMWPTPMFIYMYFTWTAIIDLLFCLVFTFLMFHSATIRGGIDRRLVSGSIINWLTDLPSLKCRNLVRRLNILNTQHNYKTKNTNTLLCI